MSKKLGQRRIDMLCQAVFKGITRFKELSIYDQDSCIEFLHYHEGFSKSAIADGFSIHRNTVTTRLQRLDRAVRARLEARGGYDSYDAAVGIIRMAELVKVQAAKDKDWRLVLDSEIQKVKTLQSLGILHEAPKEVSHSGHIGIDLSAEESDLIINAVRLERERRSIAQPAGEISPPDQIQEDETH